MRVRFTCREEDGVFIKFPSFTVPSDMPESKVVTYARGLMFEAGYVPDTPHAVYTSEDGRDWKCIRTEGDVYSTWEGDDGILLTGLPRPDKV